MKLGEAFRGIVSKWGCGTLSSRRLSRRRKRLMQEAVGKELPVALLKRVTEDVMQEALAHQAIWGGKSASAQRP
jgi:hypothetical protein